MPRTRHADRSRVEDVLEEESSPDTMRADPRSIEEQSTIRILIASDNHLGYAERDAVRGEDSFNSFREVMELAKAEEVDMVLLAGDLFHENKPSRKSMYQAMRSLRLNCLGNRPCELEVLGDQSVATEDTAVMHINYEDPEINVAIPVFSIHGNHDDPSGEGRLCALDILQVAGLLNYFGRVPENDDITVKPVLLQKGTTKLALYGISNVRDERLHRSFRHKKVRFMRPELYQDEWFNLIAVHQNHHGHSETNYLPENFIQNFFDFVVWGHEHECMIDPTLNPEQDFHVCQPGSSVATSLCAGEAVKKHVGILSIRDRSFKMRKIPLKSVRPFVFRDLTLADVSEINPKKKNKSDVIAYLIGQVEEAILESKQQWLDSQPDDSQNDESPLPLIRLRVNYTSVIGQYELENPQRFSQRFLGRVANANDIVQFYTRKSPAQRKGKAGEVAVVERPDLSEVGLTGLKVSALVKQYLAKQSLQCLPENELGDAVAQYVEKDDKDAVKDFVADHLKAQVQIMTANKSTAENNINEMIEKSKTTLANQFDVRQEQIAQRRRARESAQVSDLESDAEDSRPAPVTRAVVPQKRTALEAAKKKGPARRAPRRNAPVSEEEDAEEEVEEEGEGISSDNDARVQRARTPLVRQTRAQQQQQQQQKPRETARKPATRQARLNFTSTPVPATRASRQESIIVSSDDDEDDDDGFRPVTKRRKQ